MRAPLAAAALMALAACQPTAKAPAPAAAPATTVTEQLKERYIEALPRWMPIANQSGGGSIAYDMDNRTFDATTKIATLVLQVRYGGPMTTEFPVEGGGSTTMTYGIERIYLNYKCSDVPEDSLFAITERRVVDEQGVAKFSYKPIITDKDYKLVSNWAVAGVGFRPACAAR
jgi:hypothetical protein